MHGVYLLKSDNFDDELVTPRALKAIQLEMSTGDYNTHLVTKTSVPDLSDVWDLTFDGDLIQYPKD